MHSFRKLHKFLGTFTAKLLLMTGS